MCPNQAIETESRCRSRVHRQEAREAAVARIAYGVEPIAIATAFGVHRATLRRWWREESPVLNLAAVVSRPAWRHATTKTK